MYTALVYQADILYRVGLWYSYAETARKVGLLSYRLGFIFLFIQFYPEAYTVKRTKDEMSLIVFNLCTVNVTREEITSSGEDILPHRNLLLALV